MGGARTGGGDKPSIAPEKTLGRGPICSAAFSLRKPPRNSDSSSCRSHQTSPVAPAALRSRQISAASALSALDFSAASPRLSPCLRASASKSSAPLTLPSPQVSHPIPPRPRPWHELSGNLVNPSTIDYRQTVSYSIGLLTCPYCSVSPEDAWVFTDFVTAKPHPSPLASCHLVVAPRRHVAAFYD